MSWGVATKEREWEFWKRGTCCLRKVSDSSPICVSDVAEISWMKLVFRNFSEDAENWLPIWKPGKKG